MVVATPQLRHEWNNLLTYVMSKVDKAGLDEAHPGSLGLIEAEKKISPGIIQDAHIVEVSKLLTGFIELNA